MSNAVSALPEAVFEGYVRVEELGLNGMITLRGDLDSAALTSAVKSAIGIDMPGQRGITFKGKNGVAWMSPDEAMLFVPLGDVSKTLASLSKSLAGVHHLAVDVSDARAMFGLTGDAVREVIAKVCPVDMAPGQFAPGEIRRTRMAQIPVAIWMPDESGLRVICFRSVAQYAFDVLSDAARPGSEAALFS